jgi:hypothetical protein
VAIGKKEKLEIVFGKMEFAVAVVTACLYFK